MLQRKKQIKLQLVNIFSLRLIEVEFEFTCLWSDILHVDTSSQFFFKKIHNHLSDVQKMRGHPPRELKSTPLFGCIIYMVNVKYLQQNVKYCIHTSIS